MYHKTTQRCCQPELLYLVKWCTLLHHLCCNKAQELW